MKYIEKRPLDIRKKLLLKVSSVSLGLGRRDIREILINHF